MWIGLPGPRKDYYVRPRRRGCGPTGGAASGVADLRSGAIPDASADSCRGPGNRRSGVGISRRHAERAPGAVRGDDGRRRGLPDGRERLDDRRIQLAPAQDFPRAELRLQALLQDRPRGQPGASTTQSGATTGVPGYFVSHPVEDERAGIVGVIAVKVELRNLEANWASPEGNIYITDSNGVIVLSGQESWRFRTAAALDDETRELIATRRQFGNAELSPIDMERRGRVVTIEDERFVEHVAEVGRLGWKLHLLSPYQQVRERSRLIMAMIAVLLLSLAAFILLRRSQRAHGLLVSSERRARRNSIVLNLDPGARNRRTPAGRDPAEARAGRSEARRPGSRRWARWPHPSATSWGSRSRP